MRKQFFVIKILLVLLASIGLSHCALDTVSTQKQAAEQRQKEVDAAKKQKKDLEKKLDAALDQLEEQAEELEDQANQ